MVAKTHAIGPAEGVAHTHTVIFLHGKASNGIEFASELFESEASEPLFAGGLRTLPALFPSIRWVFPSAPESHCERFDSTESQWFDMWSVGNPEERVESQIGGLEKSVAIVTQVLADEAARLPREKIFFAGISQGFAAAVTYFFLNEQSVGRIAGLIGLCSWMPRGAFEVLRAASQVKISSRDSSNQAPVFLAHARDDSVVPIENGRALRSFLELQKQQQLIPAVEWHEYAEGGHWINEPAGVDHIVAFLRSRMI